MASLVLRRSSKIHRWHKITQNAQDSNKCGTGDDKHKQNTWDLKEVQFDELWQQIERLYDIV